MERERVEVASHVLEALEDALRNRGANDGAATCDFTNAVRQSFERHVLEEVSFRASPHRIEQRLVIVERREHDRRRQRRRALQRPQHVDAALSGHAQIQQHDVRLLALNHRDGLIAV